MRVRPFGSGDFLVDIRQGDIFRESGDLLFVGRPDGLRLPAPLPDDPDWWSRPEFWPLQRRVSVGRGACLGWSRVYSFPYRPKGRACLPNGRNDLSALHYLLVKNELISFMYMAYRRGAFEGPTIMGLVPLSWRKPVVVAHLMAEVLASLIASLARSPSPKPLTVLVRAIDPPSELYEAFDRDHFRSYRRRLGWSERMQDVWMPA